MPFDFRTIFQRAHPYSLFLERYATAEQRARWATVHAASMLTAPQKELLASFSRRMNVLCLSGPWCGDCVNACPIFQHFAEANPLIDLRFINRSQDFANQSGNPLAPAKPDPDDIRSRPFGKILVKWGILSPERIEKALLVQEDRKAQGLNARIGDVLTDMGFISAEQRDQALAAQSGFGSIEAWDTALARELSVCGGSRVPMLVFISEDWFECERFGERTLATYREKARNYLSKKEGASCPTGLMSPPPDLVASNIVEWLGHFERVQWMLLTSPRLNAVRSDA